MDEGTRGAAIAAFEKVAGGRGRRPRRHAGVRAGCGRSRSRRSTATSSRRASTRRARGRRSTSRRRSRRACEGLVVPRGSRTDDASASTSSSSARARAAASSPGELADRGRSVLLLEAGPHRTAADFTRWEAKANHDFWWPLRFAPIDGGAGGVVALLAARCVGGTTTINTKVALRVGRPRLREVARRERARRRRRIAVRRAPTSTRTTSASSSGSASACGPTGARACTPSSPASARSARISSRCTRTRTPTA